MTTSNPSADIVGRQDNLIETSGTAAAVASK